MHFFFFFLLFLFSRKFEIDEQKAGEMRIDNAPIDLQ